MKAAVPKNTQELIDFAANGEIKDNVLKLPTLWTRNAFDKFLHWTIFVGIVNSEAADLKIKRTDNKGAWFADVVWDTVDQEYIERKELSDGYISVIWQESGNESTGNVQITVPTFIKKGLNIGRVHYTTAFTQAISRARTLFDKKVHKGMVIEEYKKYLKAKSETFTLDELKEMAFMRGEHPWRVFVMALKPLDADQQSTNWKHVVYPCFIQPKLDGTHFVVVNIGGDAPTMDCYTRGREKYEGQEHIIDELKPVLSERVGLHLTGELWKKGYGLQEISGSSRRLKLESKRADAVKLEFHVFDCFYIDQPHMPYTERKALLDEVFEALDQSAEYVCRIPTEEAVDVDDLLSKYQQYLDAGNEGAIVRNMDSPYEVGITKEIRSNFTLKLKPRFDDEFPIVGFMSGTNGREVGAIIFVCAESDKYTKTALDERKTFNVTPNWPYETRYSVYKALATKRGRKWFADQVYGQSAVISYSDLSNKDKEENTAAMLPQQPKFLRFYDDAIETALMQFVEKK